MKKLILAAICIVGFAFAGQAQEISPNAIGLRLGGGEGFGPEFSYQRHLGYNNRLELDLGLRSKSDYSAFKLVGLYQWVWNIDGGFNWYAGVGAGLGNVDVKHSDDDGIFALVAGDIGIEYNFDIPLQVFIDFRPEIILANYSSYDNFGPDLAIGVRYQF